MDKSVNLYVLGVKDIQRLENLSYTAAYYRVKSENHFYINGRMYMLACDYFDTEDFSVGSVTLTKNIDDTEDIKVVLTKPKIYSSKDIREIFGCGLKQSYQIMDLIPDTFKINTKRYVSAEAFEKWLASVANKQLSI